MVLGGNEIFTFTNISYGLLCLMTVDVGEAQSGVFTQVIPRPPP